VTLESFVPTAGTTPDIGYRFGEGIYDFISTTETITTMDLYFLNNQNLTVGSYVEITIPEEVVLPTIDASSTPDSDKENNIAEIQSTPI